MPRGDNAGRPRIGTVIRVNLRDGELEKLREFFPGVDRSGAVRQIVEDFFKETEEGDDDAYGD